MALRCRPVTRPPRQRVKPVKLVHHGAERPVHVQHPHLRPRCLLHEAVVPRIVCSGATAVVVRTSQSREGVDLATARRKQPCAQPAVREEASVQRIPWGGGARRAALSRRARGPAPHVAHSARTSATCGSLCAACGIVASVRHVRHVAVRCSMRLTHGSPGRCRAGCTWCGHTAPPSPPNTAQSPPLPQPYCPSTRQQKKRARPSALWDRSSSISIAG
mmetsp:Transcript_33673/g.112410  ORF Transcript_33673/g.112410 Transcript_33673/m.112410 type:complete len:218 (+) Transcript_33673:386-1039(+)